MYNVLSIVKVPEYMTSRPAIPADLKRRLLVEAGHRCGIPRCEATQVDIHHIEPWEICKKHEYENLIVLCPNCHRRAHKGEIDRKSLSLYKALLSSIWNDRDEISRKIVNENHDRDWIIKEISEKTEQYNFDCKIPVFLENGLREINFIIEAFAISELQAVRSYALTDDRHNTVSINFTVTYFSASFLSIKYLRYSNTKGTAHPNFNSRVMNYRRNPISTISPHCLFDHSSKSLEMVSQISREYLLELSEGKLNSDWFKRGTAPEIKNFEKFNITEYGVLFTFDTYQVAPHAAGMHKVIIPFQKIRKVLNPKLGL
jgi:5-methylcytosine-specific restriction endonuclease McrA